MTLEAAMASSADGTFFATAAALSWYMSLGAAALSVLTSTLAAVALAITPLDRINIIGRKLLYCWVIPFETTIGSMMFMTAGAWADCEAQRRILLEERFNVTGSEAMWTVEHGGIVIWSMRLFIVTVGFVGFCLTVFLMCCGERVERMVGLESTTVHEEREEGSSTQVVPR